MDSDTGEVALAEKLVELGCAKGALNEDDDLVELELIEQVVELAVLLGLAELDVVLLETVEGELGLVVDVDLQRVTHELLADRTGLLGEGGREHHNLLLCGGSAEDFLHIAAHVCGRVRGVRQLSEQQTYQSGRASCHTHRGRSAGCFRDGASCL